MNKGARNRIRAIVQQARNQSLTPTYILDTYSGAAVGYSLRQLKSGVTSVVRVRRSSDDAKADFSASEITDGTLSSWVGASNDGFVTIWYDQSGNGRHLTQTTTSSQPKLVASGAIVTLSGIPVLDSWSTNAFMTLSTRYTKNDNFTVVNVAKNSYGTLSRWTWGDTNSIVVGMRSGSGLAFLDVNTYPDIITDPYVFVGALDGSSNTTFKVNTSNYTGTSGGKLEFDRAFNRYETLTIANYQAEFIIFENDYTSILSSIQGDVNSHYNFF